MLRKKIDNPYAPKHRVRERKRQRRKRSEEILKTRAQNIYHEWSEKPESPLTVGGPAVARAMVAEDLEAQGVEDSIIQKWLDELENSG